MTSHSLCYARNRGQGRFSRCYHPEPAEPGTCMGKGDHSLK